MAEEAEDAGLLSILASSSSPLAPAAPLPEELARRAGTTNIPARILVQQVQQGASRVALPDMDPQVT